MTNYYDLHEYNPALFEPSALQDLLRRICLQIIDDLRFDQKARMRWEDDGGPVGPPPIYLPLKPEDREC